MALPRNVLTSTDFVKFIKDGHVVEFIVGLWLIDCVIGSFRNYVTIFWLHRFCSFEWTQKAITKISLVREVLSRV